MPKNSNFAMRSRSVVAMFSDKSLIFLAMVNLDKLEFEIIYILSESAICIVQQQSDNHNYLLNYVARSWTFL